METKYSDPVYSVLTKPSEKAIERIADALERIAIELTATNKRARPNSPLPRW